MILGIYVENYKITRSQQPVVILLRVYQAFMIYKATSNIVIIFQISVRSRYCWFRD